MVTVLAINYLNIADAAQMLGRNNSVFGVAKCNQATYLVAIGELATT